MRFIRITRPPYFVDNQDCIVYDDADERTSDPNLTDNDVGMVARQLDGTRWRLTGFDEQTQLPTWEQVLGGTTATPEDVGDENAAGDSAAAARLDHVHAHGEHTATTDHAAATVEGAGFMSSAQVYKLDGVGHAVPVPIAGGTGYCNIQATVALLTVKNTSRQLRWSVVLNEELEEHITRQGLLHVGVAWLDDDTQTIEQLDADNSDTGATPAIVIALPNGVNAQLTLNADHTVTLAIARHATNTRSANARYFLEEIATQYTAPPAWESATSNNAGDQVILTWSDALDEESIPAAEAFTLAGTSATVADVAVDGSTVILSLETANIEYGETPTVSYVVPEVDPLLSATGDPIGPITLGEIANITPPDLVSVICNGAGTEIELTFEGALDESSVPAAGAFALSGTTATINTVGISGAVVTLTLTGAIDYGETPLVSYTVPGANPLQENVTEYPCVAFTDYEVTNAVPPELIWAITDADGDRITLIYEGALNEASTPANTDFVIGGDDATVDTVDVVANTVILELTGAIEYGDSPTITYTAGENPIESAEEYQCANLVAEPVTVAVPPAYVSSTTNNAGDEITLTWEGNLDEAAIPAPGDFTLAGTSATVDSVDVDGATVILTLTTALVEYGETPTVSYTAGVTPILSAEGYQVADLVTESVTNATPPDFVSAAANADGSEIDVVFEAALDEASTPAAGAFALSGTTATVSGVSISGTTVTLSLTGNIAYDETPLLSYTVPGSNPLQENGTGYDCVSFSDEAVTNEVPPVIVGIETNALGTELLMTYSAALDETSVPAPGDFVLNGDDATIKTVSIDDTTVRLTLDGAIEYDDSVSLDYTAGVNPLRSVEEYECAALDDEAIENCVPPAYSSGATDLDGDEITLTFEGALDETSIPAASCFDINGDDATVASVDVDGATVILTLSGAIEFGDAITVDYVVPGSNPLKSLEGYTLAALTAAAVVNNVPE